MKTLVCLNRERNVEPNLRPQKAMRNKGIRSFDNMEPKLLVLQAASSKPILVWPKATSALGRFAQFSAFPVKKVGLPHDVRI